MILPVRYMWEQLNGPQASGLSDALFEYWKSIFDDKLEYFNNISVATASDIHLTLLGMLAGLVRPNISEADKEYFYFTENAESGFQHGFSDLDDMSIGGKLSKLDEGGGIHNVSLDAEHYRALLRAWISGEGDIGSLQLLDDICYELTKLDLGSIEPFYEFDFMYDDIPVNRAPGDIYLDMRSMDNWNNPLHIYAVLQGIADSAYAPQPRIFISIGASGQVSTPVFSPAPGLYERSVDVTISVSNPTNAVIHYTTDGSTPDENSPVFIDTITITETTLIRAIGIANYYGNSAVAQALYTIEDTGTVDIHIDIPTEP